MQTLMDKWEAFERMVINEHASQAQRKEMQVAFFAGAASVLAGIINDEGRIIPELMIRALKEMTDECKSFMESLK